MQGHGVIYLIVDSFDDIDFALIGPVWTNEPAETCVSVHDMLEVMRIYYAGHVPLFIVSMLLLDYRMSNPSREENLIIRHQAKYLSYCRSRNGS